MWYAIGQGMSFDIHKVIFATFSVGKLILIDCDVALRAVKRIFVPSLRNLEAVEVCRDVDALSLEVLPVGTTSSIGVVEVDFAGFASAISVHDITVGYIVDTLSLSSGKVFSCATLWEFGVAVDLGTQNTLVLSEHIVIFNFFASTVPGYGYALLIVTGKGSVLSESTAITIGYVVVVLVLAFLTFI